MAGYIGANTSSVTNNQNAAERRKKFTFTAATTALTGLNFLPNKIHIFHNGIRLVKNTDFTEAADGKSVTLINAAQAGDEVVAVTFSQNPSSGGYSDTDVDAHLLTAGVTLDATNDSVGIGTNAPAAKFELEDGGASQTVLMKITADDSNPYSLVIGNDTYSTSDTDGLTMYVGNSGHGTINMRGTGSSLQFRTVGTERMRIDEDGYVTKPNQPCFAAYNYSAAGTILASHYNPMRWANVHANVGNCFNNTTGKFTFPVTGKYLCFCNINLKATDAQWFGLHLVYNNNSVQAASWSQNLTNSTYINVIISSIVSGSANDNMAFAWHNSYSAPDTNNSYNQAYIYLLG